MVAPWGDVVATTGHEDDVVVADVDLDKVASMRQSIPTFDQRRGDVYELQDLKA